MSQTLAPDITLGPLGEATVRVVVVQGPLPGHLPRRVWLCHLTTGLMPGCSSSSPAMPLFVPEELLEGWSNNSADNKGANA